MLIRRTVMTCLIAFSLSACVSRVSPLPDTDLDQARWSADIQASGLLGEGDANSVWWGRFNDPQLNNLIEQALLGSFDAELVRSNIRAARAQYQQALAPTRPTLGVNASTNRQRLSETGTLPVGRVPGFERDQTVYDAAFDAGWELDLFGRNQHRRRIAQARFDSTLEQQHSAATQLIAELARAYFELQTVNLQQQILQQNQHRQQRLVRTVAQQLAAGEASDLDLASAELPLSRIAQQVQQLNTEFNVLKRSLTLLIGGDRQSIELLEWNARPYDVTPITINALVTDVLRLRPDVRTAERDYVVATAEQALQELALLPTFSLFGSVGSNSTDAAQLGNSDSLTLNLAGFMQWRLYDGGARRASTVIADEQVKQAEIAYRKTVLSAAHDIEDKAARLLTAKAGYQQQQVQFETQQRIALAAITRYQAGTIGLRDLLMDEAALAERELSLISAHRDWLIAEVALAKALGGDSGAALLLKPATADRTSGEVISTE